MTITISNVTVAHNATTGTTVGVLMATDETGQVVPCNFILTKQSGGYFATSPAGLVTAWSGSIEPGFYSVRVRANAIYRRFGETATFVVNVTAVTPSLLPTPIGITFVPATVSLPDDSVAGTTVAGLAVSMSDGSTFSGAIAASPSDTVAISGNARLVLARGLGLADAGPNQWVVEATQNGVTVASDILVQVTGTNRPHPIAVAFTPSAAALPDNAPAGSLVAAVAVTMSDCSTFSGRLVVGPAGTVAIAGGNLALARDLTRGG